MLYRPVPQAHGPGPRQKKAKQQGPYKGRMRDIQILQGSFYPVPHFSGKQEPVDLGKKHFFSLGKLLFLIQPDFSPEQIIIQKDEHRDKKKIRQEEEAGRAAQYSGPAAEIFGTGISGSGQPGRRTGKSKQHAKQHEPDDMGRRKNRIRCPIFRSACRSVICCRTTLICFFRRIPVIRFLVLCSRFPITHDVAANLHEIKYPFRYNLVNGKRHQGRCLSFGILPLRHRLMDGYLQTLLPVFLLHCFYFGPDLLVFFISHKGIGGFLCIYAGMKRIQRQPHEQKRKNYARGQK